MESDIEDQQPDRPGSQRESIISLLRRRLNNDEAHEWLKARLAELGTTWTTATKAQLRAIAIELIKLRVAIPEAQETAEPIAERNVLQEIADDRITDDQVRHLEQLAHQYGVDALALAPMLGAYEAKELIELKSVHYRALVADILRLGVGAARRRGATHG